MGNFLRSSSIGDRARDAAVVMPERIGRYRIVRELGRGGMGVVYEALQERPHRTVALKVLRSALPTNAALRRFEHEAEILGHLQHPGIAQIYEAGVADVTSSGGLTTRLPFFAMELVRGLPLVEFAENRQLDVHARLSLMTRVCEAVQHAHQKGIIHRDLKPDNILIDECGQPKVLDFGVARAAGNEFATVTLQTHDGQLIGTIPYMSPEQVSGDARQVDTRSDVYALGAVLYELLTGRPAFDVRGLTLPDAARRITDDEPLRLSSLDPRFRGDIEVILARALEKNPDRRYPSCAELAADIRRYLRHEPVLARPPRALYQFAKFTRRHRGLAIGAGLALAALIAGTVGTATFAWRETRQLEQTRVQFARAEAVIRFLRQMLASAKPGALRGKDATVRQALDDAAQRIASGELAGQPELEAALRNTIGEAYLSLGHYAEARQHLDAVLAILRPRYGLLHDTVLTNLNLLGSAMDGMAQFSEGERLHLAALEAAQKLHGKRDLRVAQVWSDLGACRHRAGKLEEAEDAHRHALDLRQTLPGTTPLDLAESLANLGAVLHARSRPRDAEPLLREALQIRRAQLTPDHPSLASVLNDLGFLLYEREAYDEAESMLREGLAIYRRSVDARHPDLARCLHSLAMLVKRFQNPEAIPLLREAIDIQAETLGPSHPDLGESVLDLAHALDAVGQHDEAEREAQRALEIMRAAFGERHQDYAFALHNVAVFRAQRSDPAGAEPLLREALEILDERLGRAHEATIHMRDSLGVILTKLERYDEARALLEEVLTQRRALLGDGHGKVGLTWSNLALARLRSGDAPGAIDAARQALPLLRPDPMPAQLSTALLTLIEARLVLQEPVDPAEVNRDIDEALALRRAEYGENSWQVADAQRIRGALLAHSGQWNAAEDVLLGVLRALDAKQAATDLLVHQTRRRAIEALIGLYDVSGQPELAAYWAAKE
jgi:tetratricopeptide (TPR) repeat protein